MCLIWCYAMYAIGAESLNYLLIRHMHKGITMLFQAMICENV